MYYTCMLSISLKSTGILPIFPVWKHYNVHDRRYSRTKDEELSSVRLIKSSPPSALWFIPSPSVGFSFTSVALIGLSGVSWLGSLLKPDISGRSWPLRSGVVLRGCRLYPESDSRWGLRSYRSLSSRFDCEEARVGLPLAGTWTVRGLFTVCKKMATSVWKKWQQILSVWRDLSHGLFKKSKQNKRKCDSRACKLAEETLVCGWFYSQCWLFCHSSWGSEWCTLRWCSPLTHHSPWLSDPVSYTDEWTDLAYFILYSIIF